MIYYNSNKTESIELPDKYESNTIAISMSGGADSTILAYILAKQIIDNNLNTQLLAYTRCRNYPAHNPKIWNVAKTKTIINKITDLLKKDVFLDHYVDYPSGQMSLPDELEYVRKLELSIKEKYNCNIFMYGVTSNPSIEDMNNNNFLSERMPNRDKGISFADKSNPFKSVDKKFIRELYEQTNTIETLFPLTFSCEGGDILTENYTKHCQQCWWCRERFWAFNRYV